MLQTINQPKEEGNWPLANRGSSCLHRVWNFRRKNGSSLILIPKWIFCLFKLTCSSEFIATTSQCPLLQTCMKIYFGDWGVKAQWIEPLPKMTSASCKTILGAMSELEVQAKRSGSISRDLDRRQYFVCRMEYTENIPVFYNRKSLMDDQIGHVSNIHQQDSGRCLFGFFVCF